MKNLPAHPKNALGDFYVELNCCTACDIPRTEAPEHFEYDEKENCFICKQPDTQEQILRVLSAMEMQEFYCIKYKGKNPKILEYLKSKDMELCIVSPVII